MTLAKQPLLTTKLNIPPLRSHLVERPRLLNQLSEALQRKLTIVRAPAGYGKTTLLAHWYQLTLQPVSQAPMLHPPQSTKTPASDAQLTLSWLSLAKGDNDPDRFLTYLMASLQKSFRGSDLGYVASAMKQTPQPLPMESVLTVVINEIAESGEQSVLVLDDYHLIENEQVHILLRFFLANMPANIHIVIAARSSPPLGLSQLRARDQLLELGPDDLSFTNNETSQFWTQERNQQLTETQVVELVRKTEGWIAGLHLASLSARGSDDLAATLTEISGQDRFILDYLGEEVYADQNPDIQGFLLRTSILNQFSSPLCSYVTGIAEPQGLIEELEEQNAFIFPLDRKRKWYRYHALFADFLKLQLAIDFPEEVAELNHRAAQWWVAEGYIAEAIDHSLAAGNYTFALELIDESALAMLAGGDIGTLIRWIEALPSELFHHHPGTLLSYAWGSLISGRASWPQITPMIEKSAKLLAVSSDNLVSRLTEAQESPNLRRELCLLVQLQAFLARNSGDWDQAKVLFRIASLHSRGEPLINSISIGGLGSLYLREGRVKEAEIAFAEITTIAESIDSIYLRVLGITLQAQMQTEQGAPGRASKNYQLAISLASARSRHPLPFSGQASVGLAGLMYEWNDLDQALILVQEGIEQGKLIRDVDALMPGHYLLAQIFNAQGDHTKSRETLIKASTIGVEVAYPHCHALSDFWRARFEFAKGNLNSAKSWISTFNLENQNSNVVDPATRELELMLYCRILAVQGDGEKAIKLLDPILKEAENDGRIHRVIQILVVRAFCLHTLGRQSSAKQAIGKALLLAEPAGFVRTFLDEGPAIASLLRSTGKDGHSPEYVRILLDAFGQDQVAEHLSDPLSERELEVLQLAANGLTNQEIASSLFIAVSTVKTHINRIYSKLQSRNRSEAIARAREYYLID